MEKQDMQILEALFHGNHLNDSELERAKQLVFIIQSSFENRKKDFISKNDFELYEDVRQEGITNMFDVGAVCSLSGLTREKVFKIMNHYEELRDKFS
jgi:hypothetical protein